MHLLDMVRGKKDIGATMENTDRSYYLRTVYNLLEDGEDPMAPS